MSGKIAFITGITGQDGSYLAELLLEKGYKVYGIVRRSSNVYNYTRIDHIRDKLILKYGDMTDGSGLYNIIQEIVRNNPGVSCIEVYNLAAQSHVQVSFELPDYTAQADALGTLKLLEIIRGLDDWTRSRFKFYQAGSSEMYGKVLETPQNENTPFNPVSPYAAAKVFAHNLVKIYREAYGLFAVNGVLFNHESGRRPPNFVTMKVIKGIKDILENKREYIELGNLDSKRDWGHSVDYVRGMWKMLQQENPDDYVLATGKTYSVRYFVERAFSYKNIFIEWEGEGLDEVGKDEKGNVRIKINKKYYRPYEVDLLLGDPSKAERKLKWKREHDLDTLIEDMFNY